jgi:hypothetical protein
VAASLAALPLAAFAVVALASARGGRRRPGAWRRSLAEVGMVVGTAPWVWMILTPRPAARQVSLVPLRDLLADPDPVQIGGNLLVFLALGAFAPLRWPALAGPARLFALGAAGSAVVEILQYALDLGRVSSVDDVLLNAAGAALGGLLTRHWWKQRDGRRPQPHPPAAGPGGAPGPLPPVPWRPDDGPGE